MTGETPPVYAALAVDGLIDALDEVVIPQGYGDAEDELKSARNHLDIARKILAAPDEDEA